MATIRPITLSEHVNKFKQELDIYIKQDPYVNNDGIYIPCEEYVPDGCASAYRCVITKEMFVEAHKKYINPNNRRYKGGWKL